MLLKARWALFLVALAGCSGTQGQSGSLLPPNPGNASLATAAPTQSPQPSVLPLNEAQASVIDSLSSGSGTDKIIISPAHSPVLTGPNQSRLNTVSEAGYTGGFSVRLDASESGPNACKAANGFGGGDPGGCQSASSTSVVCTDAATGGTITVAQQSPTTFLLSTAGAQPVNKFYCAVDYVDGNGRFHRSTTTWYPGAASPTPTPTATPDPWTSGTPLPMPSPTPVPTATPTASPTPTAVPVTVSPSAVSVTVGGKDATATISQGSYTTGFSASSSNANVASASVAGTTLTIHAVSPGSAAITVNGNGGQSAQVRIKRK